MLRGIWRAEAGHRAEFCRNWSIHCGNIAIFSIFNMAAAAILDFGNRKILLADGTWRAQLHHCVIFCHKWLCYGRGTARRACQ